MVPLIVAKNAHSTFGTNQKGSIKQQTRIILYDEVAYGWMNFWQCLKTSLSHWSNSCAEWTLSNVTKCAVCWMWQIVFPHWPSAPKIIRSRMHVNHIIDTQRYALEIRSDCERIFFSRQIWFEEKEKKRRKKFQNNPSNENHSISEHISHWAEHKI